MHVGSYGSTPQPIPRFQHPSHELLQENGFTQQLYHKYHSKCLKGISKTNLHVLKISTAHQMFGTVPRLPMPRLPPGGSLSTPKIFSTGATLHLGPIRLHVENWECCAVKSSAWCQKFGMPCRFFSTCKWRLSK